MFSCYVEAVVQMYNVPLDTMAAFERNLERVCKHVVRDDEVELCALMMVCLFKDSKSFDPALLAHMLMVPKSDIVNALRKHLPVWVEECCTLLGRIFRVKNFRLIDMLYLIVVLGIIVNACLRLGKPYDPIRYGRMQIATISLVCEKLDHPLKDVNLLQSYFSDMFTVQQIIKHRNTYAREFEEACRYLPSDTLIPWHFYDLVNVC